MKESLDLIIIGSGPAGYCAAIYAGRANIKCILFEGSSPGGQLMSTTLVENFPGFQNGVLGPDLMMNMREQAQKFKVRLLSEEVIDISFDSWPYLVKGKKSSFLTKSIIIATGAESKKLNIEGVDRFWQKGVSTCAVCDGAAPIFKNKDLYVIGGGESAIEEALFLTKFAKMVYIVHRRDRLKASNIMATKAMNHPKIEILWNTEITEILGNDVVTKVRLKNNVDNRDQIRDAAGIFFAIGHKPNTDFLKKLSINENGYIITIGRTTKTNIDGVFAAGDVQDERYRQAICAAGSGCMAALDVLKWLEEKGIL